MTSLMLPAALAFLLLLACLPHHGGQTQTPRRCPGESRKLHHRSVPTVGGHLCGCVVQRDPFAIGPACRGTRSAGSVFGATIPVFFMGLKDDIVESAPTSSLSTSSSGFLVVGLDLRIDDFHGFLD